MSISTISFSNNGPSGFGNSLINIGTNILYGVSCNGGTNGFGVIYSFNISSSEITNIYEFTNTSDGANPSNNLIYNPSNYTLYGICFIGGSYGAGTIFSYNLNSLQFETIYSFMPGNACPVVLIFGLTPNIFYGIAYYANNNLGSIFKYNINDLSSFEFIYNFNNNFNGGYAPNNLILHVPTNTLYGTCVLGGINQSNQYGTIFSYNINSSTGNSNLYNFTNSLDGANPMGSIYWNGNKIINNLCLNTTTNTFYGTCYTGGYGYGTIFGYDITNNNFEIIYQFSNGLDGAFPLGGIFLDSLTNTLYGTCYSGGGPNNYGTIFRYTIGETNTINSIGLYQFTNSSDGFNSTAMLTLNSNILYGICSNGGTNNIGTLFEYTLSPPPPVTCFNKGTNILCLKNECDVNILVENLKIGDMVKTLFDYKKIVNIGIQSMYSCDIDKNIDKNIDNNIDKNIDKNIDNKNKMCKLSKYKYHALTEDLYMTGAHSILVNSISDLENEKITKMLGKIYITDGLYRLPVCLVSKIEFITGKFEIYHIALENENYYFNYGIYANNLLVESCSIYDLTECSNMNLLLKN